MRAEILFTEPAASYPDDLKLQDPFCPYFGRCGGCRGQRFEYGQQLSFKAAPILEAIEQSYGFGAEVIPAPQMQAYRNRMDFVVNGAVLGLRPAGDFSTFVDIESCPLQNEKADLILSCCREALMRNPGVGFIRPVQTEEGEESELQSQSTETELLARMETGGPLKYITIRSGTESGVVVLSVLPGAEEHQVYIGFIADLNQALREGSAAALNYSLIETPIESSSEVSCGTGGRVLSGKLSFASRLGGLEFDVPYDSFFQPNPEAFDVLLEKIFPALEEELARHEPGGELTDFYCGSGTLSAIIASRFPGRFSCISGYEFTVSAIERATDNLRSQASIGMMPELRFEAMDLNQVDAECFGEGQQLLILDPPRAGLSPSMIKRLRENSRAPIVLYISCNPKSQLHNLKELAETYELIHYIAVDCYAQTPHMEAAALLRLRH